MFHRSILSIAICIVAAHSIFGDQRQVKSSVFQINHKKPVHAVSDKFLSFTVDPNTLLHVAECQLTNASLSLIKGLLPAYLRVAGADSNRLLFKSLSDGKFSSDLSASTSSKSKSFVLSGNQWNKFYEFVSSTGLNLIVCLSGGIFNEQTDRDLSNALEFITFSNKNNFNINWQLGYELQKISRDDGKETGQDVAKLRKILEVFPRYQNSLIIGPDVTNFESRENILFLRNYLLHAQNSLNVFTIHPNFTTIPDKDLYDALSDLFSKMDTYLWLREGIFKTASKGVVPKKPIWIAESENKESECKFSDSISLIKRLGFAAKLGASVYLRKPHLLSLYEPTSEFWAASLFKALVGRSVLDTRLANGNNSSVVAFSHCTQILEKPEESIINPTIAYERGSITAYGVNTEAEPVHLIFKTGIKTEETVHMYVLTEDSKNGGKTLVNRQHLGLSDENDLPMLSPKIRESAESIVIPAHSIFFLVFPNIRCRACMQQPIEDTAEAIKAKIKPSIPDEEELIDTSETTVNLPENHEELEDENAVYVSYPTKSERIKAAHERLPKIDQVAEEIKQLRLEGHSIGGPKYYTFSEGTWLSSFPDQFKEIEQLSTDGLSQDSQSKKEKRSKIEKYRVLAQAIVGQRNVTAKSFPKGEGSVIERDMEDNRPLESRIKRLMRAPRSVRSLPSAINSLYQQTRDNSHYAFYPYDLPISEDLEESNKIPAHWFRTSRQRRDTEGNDSFELKDSPKNMIDFFVENTNKFPATSTNLPSAGESKPSVDKMNPPSMQPELVAESDESTNIRQHREIDGKSLVSSTNLASDTKIPAEDKIVESSFGPVSPFPRHHMKPTKTKPKITKLKKTPKSPESYKDESNEGISSEANLEMSPKRSTVQPADATEENAATNAKISSSEIPAESQTTTTLSPHSTSESKMEESGNAAETVPSTDSKARSVDSSAEHEISPKHAKNEQIISKAATPSLHSATHKNKALTHPIHPTHQNEPQVLPVHPVVRPRAKDLKAKTTPRNPLSDFMRKIKDDTSKLQPPLDPNQVIDLAHARIQELLNIHKARMEERQRKIQEAATNKRQESRNLNHGRNKREAIDSVPAVEPKSSLDQSTGLYDVGASVPHGHLRRGHAQTHLRGSTEAPSRTAPAVPRKEKPTRKQFQVPQKNTHDLRHVTTKSPVADKHKTRLHPRESKLDRPKTDRHRLQKRDLFDDLYSKVKNVYEDVSTNVQKKLAPVEKWVEEKADDVTKEFSDLRTKRDLQALEQKLRERKERFRQKIEEIRQRHRIHVRDVGNHHQAPKPAHHFDEQIKDYGKHLHHTADPQRRMKHDHERGRENNLAGLSLHKIEIPENFIDSGKKNRFIRSPLSNKLFEEDKQENAITFDDSDSDILPSLNEVNKSSVEESRPRVLGNFSDILSPPEKKSAVSNDSQCDGTNFLLKMWCETMMLFSSFFKSA